MKNEKNLKLEIYQKKMYNMKIEMFVIVNKITLKRVLSKVRSNQSSANRGSDVGKSSYNSRARKNTNLR